MASTKKVNKFLKIVFDIDHFLLTTSGTALELASLLFELNRDRLLYRRVLVYCQSFLLRRAK